MAYSAGFTPHPKISYAGAAPTGAASEAEYVEIGVIRRCDPGEIRTALDDALPNGLDIVEVIESPGGALAELMQASVWRIVVPGVLQEAARTAVSHFLSVDEVPVERLTKSGLRSVDARAAVLRLEVIAQTETAHLPVCAILHVVVRHTTPSVRPDDILTALRSVTGLAPADPAMVTRLAQGPLNEQTCEVADPFRAAEVSSTSQGDAS